MQTHFHKLIKFTNDQIGANAVDIFASGVFKRMSYHLTQYNTRQPFIARDKVSIDGGTTYLDVVSANSFSVVFSSDLLQVLVMACHVKKMAIS